MLQNKRPSSRPASPGCRLSSISGSTMAKWSASIRATRLASPVFCVSHSATCFSSASPADRPRLSLMFLNRSRSHQAYRKLVPAAGRAVHILRCPFEKQAAVGETGKHVVIGEIIEPFPLFDVIDRERNVRRLVRQQLQSRLHGRNQARWRKARARLRLHPATISGNTASERTPVSAYCSPNKTWVSFITSLETTALFSR